MSKYEVWSIDLNYKSSGHTYMPQTQELLNSVAEVLNKGNNKFLAIVPITQIDGWATDHCVSSISGYLVILESNN